jgi:hypothetical protein
MSKHTPGPWQAEEVTIHYTENTRPTGWINGPDGKPVVEYGKCGSHEAVWPNPADKLLALAAPEMYEALKMLPLDTLSRTPTPDDYAKLLNAMRAARDVLAKLN